MSIEQALGAYCQERFTDDDVIRCTGLSFRAWRELLRTRAVRTISEKRGRGRVRLCDATTLKRAAAIAAINQAGLSLPVSGQIAYWWPVHSLLFEVCDPRSIGALTRPNVDWFEPNRPAGSEPGDWLIEFYDSRFVGARYGRTNEPAIFGDVRDAGMRFVAWYPSHSKQHVIGTAIEQLAGKIYRIILRWTSLRIVKMLSSAISLKCSKLWVTNSRIAASTTRCEELQRMRCTTRSSC